MKVDRVAMKRILLSVVFFLSGMFIQKNAVIIGQAMPLKPHFQNLRMQWMSNSRRMLTSDSIPARQFGIPDQLFSPLVDIAGINLLINRYDVYIRRKSWAEVSAASWKVNINRGFLTDGDGFSTNWFAHPFHGALFYNSARLHGLSYYASFPYIIGGSLMWEYFGETEPPSEIDIFTTSLGGMFLGEASYRISDYLWNYPFSGGSKALRSVLATVINPAAGLHRYVFQRTIPYSRQSLQPVQVNVLAGVTVPIGLTGQMNSGLTLQADLFYGQKKNRSTSHFHPFDHFDMHAWLHFSENERGTITPYFNLMSHAILLGTKLRNEAGHTQIISLSQHYDFIHNDVFKIGSVVVTGDWEVIREFDKAALSFAARLGVVLFGSGNSEQVTPVYPDIFPYFERDYIYGQGYVGEVEFSLGLGKAGSVVGSLHHFVIYSRSEPSGQENLTLGRSRYIIPVTGKVSAGLQYDYYLRNAEYYLVRGYETTQKSHQEIKLVVGYAL